MTRRSGTPTTRAGTDPGPPEPKARTAAEIAFLGLGTGAQRWLVEAAAVGAARIRSKMAGALELAALVGAEQVDAALMLAATAGRFDDGAAGLDRGPPRGGAPATGTGPRR